MEPRKKPQLNRLRFDNNDDSVLLWEKHMLDVFYGRTLEFGTPETRALDKALTSDWVHFDAGVLPEIIITPPKDNAVYKMNYMIPNKELRNLFYNSINKDYDQRLYINRLWNLYNKAQKPTIKSTRSNLNISMPILQKMGIMEGDRDRARYSALTNTMFVSPDETASNIEEELAHAYLYYGTDVPRKWGFLDGMLSLPGDIKIKGKSGYERPGNLEFNAHSIIEPLFNLYLTNENIYYNDARSIIDDMYNPANRDFYFPEIKRGPRAGYIKTFENDKK